MVRRIEMKKVLALIFCLLICVSASACKKSQTLDESTTDTTSSVVSSEKSTAIAVGATTDEFKQTEASTDTVTKRESPETAVNKKQQETEIKEAQSAATTVVLEKKMSIDEGVELVKKDMSTQNSDLVQYDVSSRGKSIVITAKVNMTSENIDSSKGMLSSALSRYAATILESIEADSVILEVYDKDGNLAFSEEYK